MYIYTYIYIIIIRRMPNPKLQNNQTQHLKFQPFKITIYATAIYKL